MKSDGLIKSYMPAQYTDEEWTELIELQRQDVEFRFDSDKQISRFGSGRRTDGSEQGVLTIITGDGALAESDNPQVVAFADSLAGLPAVILFELREPRSS